MLARALGNNVGAARRWINSNWGPNADLGDPAHPVYAASLPRASPPHKLAEAQDAVASACRRYQAATGRDGFKLARQVIEDSYGAEIASIAMKPIEAAAAVSARIARAWEVGGEASTNADLEIAIDELISDAPLPDASVEQRQAGRSAIAEWMLSEPELDGVTERLGALLSVCNAGGYPTSSDTFSATTESLGARDTRCHRSGVRSRVHAAHVELLVRGNWRTKNRSDGRSRFRVAQRVRRPLRPSPRPIVRKRPLRRQEVQAYQAPERLAWHRLR